MWIQRKSKAGSRWSLCAQPNQFPWVVGAYVVLDARSKVFECSGALISKKHTLFSAYCTTQISGWWPKIEVRLGINAPNTMKRGISRFFTHENFNTSKFDFDIAIWQLDENVAFGFNIQPICLPSSPLNDYTGKLATAAAWYHDDLKRKRYAPTSMTSYVLATKLHEIRVPIWTNKMCAEMSNHPKRITNNMICAGEYEDGIRLACMEDGS